MSEFLRFFGKNLCIFHGHVFTMFLASEYFSVYYFMVMFSQYSSLLNIFLYIISWSCFHNVLLLYISVNIYGHVGMLPFLFTYDLGSVSACVGKFYDKIFMKSS